MNFFKKKGRNKPSEPLFVFSPVTGTALELSSAADPVFASEALGKGAVIQASGNEVSAPVSGTITTFFPTGHAVGITTDDGAEILVHVGVDTVELNGKYFHPARCQGDTVRQGDLLLTAELEQIRAAGYDTSIMLVVTNSADYPEITCRTGSVDPEVPLLEIRRS